jgi:hypothetical protein
MFLRNNLQLLTVCSLIFLIDLNSGRLATSLRGDLQTRVRIGQIPKACRLWGFGLTHLEDSATTDRDSQVVMDLLVLLGELVGKLLKKGLVWEGSRVAIKACLHAQRVVTDLLIVPFLLLFVRAYVLVIFLPSLLQHLQMKGR